MTNFTPQSQAIYQAKAKKCQEDVFAFLSKEFKTKPNYFFSSGQIQKGLIEQQIEYSTWQIGQALEVLIAQNKVEPSGYCSDPRLRNRSRGYKAKQAAQTSEQGAA